MDASSHLNTMSTSRRDSRQESGALSDAHCPAEEQSANQQLEERNLSMNQQTTSTTELTEISPPQDTSGEISFALASGIMVRREHSNDNHSSSSHRAKANPFPRETHLSGQAHFTATEFDQSPDFPPLAPLPQSVNLATFSKLPTEIEEIGAMEGEGEEEEEEEEKKEKEEEERLSSDASDQAEHITIDENLESLSDGSDYGYDSDEATSASTSVAPSVRNFLYENGWRYHRYREGSYNFPNDGVEQEREDLKHAMVKLLCGEKLHFAPIGDYPQEILDIGTGTGIWPIEMGDRYPSARILGVDLSPIQPDWLPPNVRFLLDDVESQWLYPRNHFDYIHTRHTIMAIRDWRKLFCQALEHLKPGGWIELQEIHHCPKNAQLNQEIPPDHPMAKFWVNVTQGLRELGVDFYAVADGQLSTMLREVGFTNVTERVLHIPIGPWPKNKILKRVGLYWRTILLDGLQAIGIGPFTRGLKWTRDEMELFLVDVRRAFSENALLMYMPFHVIQAQKPLQTAS